MLKGRRRYFSRCGTIRKCGPVSSRDFEPMTRSHPSIIMPFWIEPRANSNHAKLETIALFHFRLKQERAL
jgi:hypothetical protein